MIRTYPFQSGRLFPANHQHIYDLRLYFNDGSLGFRLSYLTPVTQLYPPPTTQYSVLRWEYPSMPKFPDSFAIDVERDRETKWRELGDRIDEARKK